jgi:hypothetical protein
MQSANLGVDWLKLGSFGAVSVAAWAISLIPTITLPIQGLFASSAVVASALLVADARRADRLLTWGEIHQRVDRVTGENEIAYAAAALDQQLQNLYLGCQNATYSPEVAPPDCKLPETALEGDSSGFTSQLTTYDPRFTAACRALLMAGKSKTWVTENVLGLTGRNFELETIERILASDGPPPSQSTQ